MDLLDKEIRLLVVGHGIDTAFIKMLECLADSGRYQIYITYDRGVAQPSFSREKLIYLPLAKVKSKWNSEVVRELRGYIRRYGIQLIFAPSSSGLSNALFSSLFTGARCIGYRGTQAKIRRYDPTYYLGILNPRLRHVICETPDIAVQLSRYISKKKLSTHTKPFSLDWVREAIEHPLPLGDNNGHSFKCIYIGSTKGRPYKGLSYLLQAFILLGREDASLYIIGDYDDEDYQLAEGSAMREQIHFLGFQREAIRYLPSADLFVLPSLRDASPRVVREALACGVPCIVTDIPGARDLIDDQSGVLVSPASGEALAKAIAMLMDQPSKLSKLKQGAQERIIKHFSVEHYVAGLDSLFSNLLRKR